MLQTLDRNTVEIFDLRMAVFESMLQYAMSMSKPIQSLFPQPSNRRLLAETAMAPHLLQVGVD